MPASEAQIRANQANAARSTGPKTDAGKMISRANALTHGLAGSGIVLPEEDVAKVEKLTADLAQEFGATSGVGALLVRQLATVSVRLDRSFNQEMASLSERVRTVMEEFVPPEGVDAETAEALRNEAGNIAFFDPSKPACLARKYEAADRRSFFRILKDLRQLQKGATQSSQPTRAVEAPKPKPSETEKAMAQTRKAIAELGSFLPRETSPPPAPAKPIKPALKHLEIEPMPWERARPGVSEVDFAIGGRR